MTSTTYRNEIKQLHKGIIVSWIINILVMSMTIEAAIIFSSMSTHESNHEIMETLKITIPISLIIGLIATCMVSLCTRRILMGAATGDMERVDSGMVHNVVEEMSIASNIDTPETFILHNSGIANAYAIKDSKESRVVITEELVSMLNRQELQGVLAHEIGHLTSDDSKAMTTLTAMTAFTGIVAGSVWRMVRGEDRDNKENGFNIVALALIIVSFVFLLFAPMLAKISQAYMSRERESNADMLSVKYTGNPNALANALYKLDKSDEVIDKANARRFDQRAGYLALHAPHLKGINMDSHPPIEQRIQTLVNMGAQIEYTDNDEEQES